MRIAGTSIIVVIGLGALYCGTRAWGDPRSDQLVAAGVALLVLASAIALGSRIALKIGSALGVIVALSGAFALVGGVIAFAGASGGSPGGHGWGLLGGLVLGGGGVIVFLVGVILAWTLARAASLRRDVPRPV